LKKGWLLFLRAENRDGSIFSGGFKFQVYLTVCTTHSERSNSPTEIFLHSPDEIIFDNLDGSGLRQKEYLYLNGEMVAKVDGQDQGGIVSLCLRLLFKNNNN